MSGFCEALRHTTDRPDHQEISKGQRVSSKIVALTEDDPEPSIADQALRWFVLLHSGNETGADRQDFQSWLEANEMHHQEFEKVSSLWRELDAAKPLLHDELTRVDIDWKG